MPTISGRGGTYPHIITNWIATQILAKGLVVWGVDGCSIYLTKTHLSITTIIGINTFCAIDKLVSWAQSFITGFGKPSINAKQKFSTQSCAQRYSESGCTQGRPRLYIEKLILKWKLWKNVGDAFGGSLYHRYNNDQSGNHVLWTKQDGCVGKFGSREWFSSCVLFH